MSEERVTRVINEHRQPVELTLTKGARSGYRWSFTIKAESVDEALRLAQHMDLMLNLSFAQPRPEEPSVEGPAYQAPEDPHAKMNMSLERIYEAGKELMRRWEAEG